MGNFQVTLTSWKFFLQTVHEKGFLKASERPQKNTKKKKLQCFAMQKRTA